MAQVHLLSLLLLFSVCGLRASLLKGFPECNSWFDEFLENTVDPESLTNGASYLAYAAQVSSAEECQNICCTTKGCDLAVVENNQGLKCHLVNCPENGVDSSCVLAGRPNFNSYRRHTVLPQVLTSQDEDQNKVTEDTTAYAEYCLTEPAVGLCKASMPRYFYNSNAKMCQTFIYGGCMGNKNNYLTEEECQAKCAERCMAKKETGPCRASFMSWYFDPIAKNCLPFTYGGCLGNQNRYESVKECMDSCAAGPAYNYNQPGHNVQTHYNKVFFLASVLSIMTVLLVIGLILISVKRIKSRQVIVKEDKEELLPAYGHNDSA
ncbi:SPIT2 inhibitor, partial [Polypterus senegalus]